MYILNYLIQGLLRIAGMASKVKKLKVSTFVIPEFMKSSRQTIKFSISTIEINLQTTK